MVFCYLKYLLKKVHFFSAVQGVFQSPTTGDKVHLVTIRDLNIIYGGYEKNNSISVGNISASSSLDARIDLDKMVARHCAILGSTGSGKSNAVGVILKEISNRNFKSSRILLIDPHGEYNHVFKDSNLYKIRPESEEEKPFYVPFWALPFNELIGIFSGHLNDQQRDYIREKIKTAKVNVVNKYNEDFKRVEINLVTADTPIPFSIKKLWYELDDFERQTYKVRGNPDTKNLRTTGNVDRMVSNEYEPAGVGSSPPFLNNQSKGLLKFLDGVRLTVLDSNYQFLFSPGDYTPSEDGKIIKKLENLLFDWLSSSCKNITIFDISGVPSEIATSISGTLLKIIYDALFWGQKLPIGGREQPLLIVLEEAHSYLKSGTDSISSTIVQTIAKEGRKYGVGLALITQRPSELDETVLSQCGTIIALRMNNAKDRGHIQSAIQDELHTMIDLLPSLRTGEGIISGEGVKIPSRVQFYKLPYAPASSDPKVSEKWSESKDITLDNYEKMLYNWINQKINSGG